MSIFLFYCKKYIKLYFRLIGQQNIEWIFRKLSRSGDMVKSTSVTLET